jgi:hypothetical protein
MRKRHKSQQIQGTLCQNCLYGTKDTVNPLTTIGHEDVNAIVTPANKKGMESVSTRIAGLIEQRHDSEYSEIPGKE